MPVTINTNAASLGAQRELNATQSRLSKGIERLSSGFRVNRAADDAAGLAISSALQSDMRSMVQARRNASDAISMLQTAEGGMSEIQGLLNRMRELATQAATSGSLGSAERSYLDLEFESLKSEINRISTTMEFNGQPLIDGSLSAGVGFQVGFQNSANDRITVTFDDSDSTALNVNSSDISTASTAMDALELLDNAIQGIASNRATLGAAQNRLSITVSNLGMMHENLTAANSRIMDADVAEETSLLTRNQILMQAGTAVLAQANQIPQIALQLIGG